MQIDVKYAHNVNSAPAGFKATIQDVVKFLEQNYSDPITINVKVEYKSIGGLGESEASYQNSTYHKIVAALKADAMTADDATAVASLPAHDPISGTHTYTMTTAEEKALGLLGANAKANDGTVTFTSKYGFDYDRSDGITAGKYDFYGIVAHEITEVMGRVTFDGTEGNYDAPLDLFHFSSAGHRTFSGTTPGYFSIDNGTTDLLAFYNKTNGDFGDWANNAGNDSFRAFSDSGVVNAVSETDLREMDILGFDRVSGGGAHADPAHVAIGATGALGHHLVGDWMTHSLFTGIGDLA